MIIPEISSIPQEIAALQRWHAWRMIDGRKLPIDASGRAVDHVKARTTFAGAVAIAKRHGGGLGFSIDNEIDGTDIVFIDLDGCLDPDGTVKAWAKPIVERFAGTYSQVSASGTGMHFLCRGKWPAGFTKVDFGGDHHNAQVFHTKRFVAMTGAADPKPVKAAQDALNWLAEYLAGFVPEKPLRASQGGSGASGAGSAAAAGSGFRTAGDWPSIRSRALAYLEKVEPAVDGEFGGTRTLETAMKVVGGFDLTEAEAFEVLSVWNLTCRPPREEKILRRKITEAMKFITDRGSLLRASAAVVSTQNGTARQHDEPKSAAAEWIEGQPYPEIDLEALGHVQAIPFPLDQVPSPLGEIAIKAAETIRTHPDLIAVSMLAVLGAATGRAVNVRIRSGWTSWPSAWYALVSNVGFGKSPSIAFAERELKRTDAELVSESLASLQKWETECEATPKGEPKPPKPPMLRVRMRAGTLAALIDCHRQNELGLLYSPDELTTWLAGMGEFSKGGGSDRSNWLSARTGGDLSQDRVSGGLRYVPHSAITVLGGLPPAKLDDFLEGSGDGLIERLMFAYPDHHHRPDPPSLESDEPDLCPEWDTIVQRMFWFRNNESADFRTEPIILSLTDDREAAEAFHAFECRMTACLNDDPESPLAGFCSKIPHDVAHWSMTFALVDAVQSEQWPNTNPIILAHHVNSAAAVAEYFLGGASKILESMGGIRKNDRRVIRKIMKDRPQTIDRVWLNGLFNGRTRPEPEALDRIIERLAKACILLGQPAGGQWRVNPNAWGVTL